MGAAFSIGNFILGVIGIATGIWMLIKAFYINHHLLFVGWVERKYGPGRGTDFYRLLGLLFILFFFFVLLGYFDLASAFSGGSKAATNSINTSQTVPTTTTTIPNRLGQ